MIIGSGAREHALAYQVAYCADIDQVYVAPGNAGTERQNKVKNIAITEPETLLDFALKEKIDLTIVGPEQYLMMGIVDLFSEHQLNILGPNQKAAQLEGSKVFAKKFLEKYQINTAKYRTFHQEQYQEALIYLMNHNYPVVIKADGLAAGKGVFIAQNYEEASKIVTEMLKNGLFATAGHRIVIEEFIEGQEMSFMILLNGQQFVTLPTSQDYKKAYDYNLGPNTGGMGAYSPSSLETPELTQRIIDHIVLPTIEGLQKENMHYRGFLYFGLMIKKGIPYVIEYNCRLGDPETQVILPRIQSSFVDLCLSCFDNTLSKQKLQFSNQKAVTVVLSNIGYPKKPIDGDIIEGLNDAIPEKMLLFHAGTVLNGNQISTRGGRVISVSALADTLSQARDMIYTLLSNKKITWRHMYYRRDIAATENELVEIE